MGRGWSALLVEGTGRDRRANDDDGRRHKPLVVATSRRRWRAWGGSCRGGGPVAGREGPLEGFGAPPRPTTSSRATCRYLVLY